MKQLGYLFIFRTLRLTSTSDLALAEHDKFGGRQFGQTHRTKGMQFGSADPYFRP